MVGKTVKVIAFEIEEDIAEAASHRTLAELKEELKGVTVDMTGFKFNREEANDYD